MQEEGAGGMSFKLFYKNDSNCSGGIHQKCRCKVADGSAFWGPQDRAQRG